jgi:hypothetical protein
MEKNSELSGSLIPNNSVPGLEPGPVFAATILRNRNFPDTGADKCQ